MRKNLRILDPCCGNGNFPLVVWNKLRPHHAEEDIFNTLVFRDMNEIRLRNVQNIFRGNFELDVAQEDFFEAENAAYDLICYNPPYAKILENGKRAAKNHTLVRDFTQKALKLLAHNGYLAFIIPDNWMSLADRNIIVKEVTDQQIIWLNIHGAKKWFPKVGSSFTWLVLKKISPDTAKQPFVVECTLRGKKYTSTLDSQQRDFIPLLYTKEVQSILSKTIEADNEKFKIQTSSDLHKYTKANLISKERDEKHPYRLIHTPRQTVWASRPHKFQQGHKVFISTTDKYKVFIDADCGMTQSIAFILCQDKAVAQQIKKQLDHPLYRFLNNICRWGNFNNIRILQKFPIPTKDDVYQSFNLDNEEIAFIERNNT